MGIDATHDFENSEQFSPGETYVVGYRAPTDHRTIHSPLGLALEDLDGHHRGWIKEENRQSIEPFIAQDRRVEVLVTRLGNRWVEEDSILHVTRLYRRALSAWRGHMDGNLRLFGSMGRKRGQCAETAR